MGVTRVKVKPGTYYETIVNWLVDNVGTLLWSRPILEWQGRGWHMESAPPDVWYAPAGILKNPKMSIVFYVVDFEDEKKAFEFALRWS